MAKSILGFDFGADSLKIAKLSGGNVVKTVTYQLPDNIIKNGTIVSYDAMADEIRNAVKSNKLGGCPAAVILPSKHVTLKRFDMPLMTVEHLATNLPYEFHDYLDMDKDNYFYDYIVNELKREDPEEAAKEDYNPEESGPRMDITAAAVPKTVINDYRAMFKAAGVKLITAIPTECAYSNLLLKAGISEDTETCFITLGNSVSCVTFFDGTVFETNRVKETGLSTAFEIIADEKNVDIHMAKEYYRSNYQNLQESENILTLYNAIAADVRKTINFYRFSNRDSQIDFAYCHGAGSTVPAFRNAIIETAEIGLKSIDELIPYYRAEGDPGDYAMAIGAALQQQ